MLATKHRAQTGKKNGSDIALPPVLWDNMTSLTHQSSLLSLLSILSLLPLFTFAMNNTVRAPTTVIAKPVGNGSILVMWTAATNLPIPLPTPPTQTISESTVFSPLVGSWLPNAFNLPVGIAQQVDIASFDHRFQIVCVKFEQFANLPNRDGQKTGCFVMRVDGFSGCSARNAAGVCTSGQDWQDGVETGQLRFVQRGTQVSACSACNHASTNYAVWLQSASSGSNTLHGTPRFGVQIAVLDVPNQNGQKIEAMVCHQTSTNINCKLGQRTHGSGYPNFQKGGFSFQSTILGLGNLGGTYPTTQISMTVLLRSRLVIVCGHSSGPPKDLGCLLVGDPAAQYHVCLNF